jgi:hypothetical protein
VNYLGSELRMTDAHDGVLLANANQVRVRVPYAMGLVCATSSSGGGQITAAFMPVDSTLFSTDMGYTGFALRNPLVGQSSYYMNGTPPVSASAGTCTSSPANMTLMPGATVWRVQGSVSPLPAIATPIMLIRYVEFAFEASTLVPGRRALWRKELDQSGNVLESEELVAPFDSAARFRFFILNSRVPSDTVPTSLANLRGLEIRLAGESERTVQGRSTPEQANLVTSVFFLNRLD